LIDEKAIDEDIEEMNNFTDETNLFITKLYEYSSTFEKQSKRAASTTSSTIASPDINKIRLPKLELPKLDDTP